MEMNSPPAGSGAKALAYGDPLGSVTSGLHTRFVFQRIAAGSARSFRRGSGMGSAGPWRAEVPRERGLGKV